MAAVPGSTSSTTSSAAIPHFDAGLYESALATLAQPQRPPRYPGIALLASVAVFFLSAMRSHSLWAVVVLVGVLAFHEAGHVVAMRALGYRDIRVLFLPFLGALSIGEEPAPDAWKTAVVALAGPLPGIVVGGVAALVDPASYWLQDVWRTLLLVNGFNLLPLSFLDGGRLAQALLFTRTPGLGVLFAAASTLGLAVLGWTRESWLLFVVAMIALLMTRSAYRVAREAAALRDAAAAGDASTLWKEMAPRVFEAALRLTPLRRRRLGTVAAKMREIARGAVAIPVPRGLALAVASIWAAGLACSYSLGEIDGPRWRTVALPGLQAEMPGRANCTPDERLPQTVCATATRDWRAYALSFTRIPDGTPADPDEFLNRVSNRQILNESRFAIDAWRCREMHTNDGKDTVTRLCVAGDRLLAMSSTLLKQRERSVRDDTRFFASARLMPGDAK
jgi:Zn-dependent protease